MLAMTMPTARTRGNWNNALGVPLSLLGMSLADEIGVFEIGMNHPGELAPLCQILLPTWGVVTNIGPVHMEFFESVKAIALEKAEVLRALPENGTAVLNRDTQFFDLLRTAASGQVLTVSMQQADADYLCVERSITANGMLAVIREKATGQRHVIQIPVMGDHNIVNAMLAIAVARGHRVLWPDIRRALQYFVPQPMRWERKRIGGLTLINDAYNANPMSMRAALEAFRQMATTGRKWLVLGGMLELGRISSYEHRELGHVVGRQAWEGLITVGELGQEIAAGAEDAGFGRQTIFRCEDASMAAQVLAERCQSGDIVLLKASRGIRLETLLPLYREKMGAVAGAVSA
jgi:UDP-N-acetylmuramoyl-tripeptide--D-alanyl-D-alanine ligase